MSERPLVLPVDARPFELLTLERIHRLLEPHISAVLLPLGFEVSRTLVWVRSADAPIRQIFEVLQYKGGVVQPSWGLSLDFVPHVSGSQVKWHRTLKSARLDLHVRPHGSALYLPYIHGESGLLKDAPAILPEALSQATELWRSVREVAELPGAFERLKRYYDAGIGLGFYNYVQHPLAYGFSLAKTGRYDEAIEQIDRWAAFERASAVETRVRELLRMASAGDSRGAVGKQGV